MNAPPATRPLHLGTSAVRALVTTLVALIFAASCGTSGDAATPETLTPTSGTTATTQQNTTTTKPSTTEDETTTTVPAEELVLEVHEHFMTEFFARDESTLTVQERKDRVRAVAVDPLLTRVLQRTDERERDGSYEINPGYDSNVVEVEVDIDAETAFVLDCSLDLGVLYDADGDVLVGADEEHRIRRIVLVLTDDGWFVSDFFTGGDPCTPGA